MQEEKTKSLPIPISALEEIANVYKKKMAKKENKGFFSNLFRDELIPLVTKYFKNKLDEEIKGVQKEITKRVNFNLRKMYLSLTIFLGAVFLMIGFTLLIEHLISFPRGSGFILIGLIIILGSFIVKSFMRQ